MRVIKFLALLFISHCTFAQQNVGIGTTTPDSSAILDVKSTNKGFLMPRLTYSQRNAIAKPTEGLMVYQTDSVTGLYSYMAGKWYVARYELETYKVFVPKDSFLYSSNIQKYTVPKGVQKIRLTMQGVQGGDGIFEIIDESNYRYLGFTTKYAQGQNGEQQIAVMNVQENDTISIAFGTKPITTTTNMSGGLPGGVNGIKNSYTEYITPVFGGPFGGVVDTKYTYFHHYSGGSGGATQIFLKRSGATTLVATIRGGHGGVVPSSLIPNAGNNPSGYSFFINSFASGIAPPSSIANAYFASIGLSTSTSANGFVLVEEFIDNNKVLPNTSFSGSSSPITYANTTADGIITSTNFNAFNNKLNGSGTAGQLGIFSNSNTLNSNANLNFNTTNNRLGVNVSSPTATIEVGGNAKISSLAGTGNRLVGVNADGELVATNASLSGSDNMGNHNAVQNIQLNGNYISFDGSNNGLHINNTQNIGISTIASTNSKLRVNSANTGTGFTNWIAGDFGGTAGDRVVMGVFNGEATIAAHSNTLTGWSALNINPGGAVKIPSINNVGTKMVTVGADGTLGSSSIPISNVGTVTNVSGTGAISVTNNTSNPTIAVAQANTSTTGVLSSTDWNTFNNKQNSLVNANAVSNGILTATDWNTFNNKQNALTNANTSTNGILTAIDWNTFNNKYNLPSLTSGSVLFSNGTTITQNNSKYFWNNTSNQLGIGTNTPNTTLTVNSTNDGTGTTDWVASNVGGTAGDRVVSGVLNGKATIGGHTNALNGWTDITINPTTSVGATVTIGNDANVAPTSGTDAAGLNTKLIVNGHIRQGYYQKTVSLNAGTQTTITWTHNLNYGPIVMMSTDQNGGGANMVDVTYTTYNNNANQTVFVLKNNGSGTATGTFRWIVVN